MATDIDEVNQILGRLRILDNEKIGCIDKGFCPKCKNVVRSFTCFCNMICPKCHSRCTDIPDGKWRVRYTTSDDLESHYWETYRNNTIREIKTLTTTTKYPPHV